jgi:hypothetical protein
MPPAPQSPQCNVPGTVGTVVYVQSVPAGALAPVGIMPYGVNGAVKIMGSGSPVGDVQLGSQSHLLHF